MDTGTRCLLLCPRTRSRPSTRPQQRVRILWVLPKKGVFTPASTRASCPHTNCERCHRCELKINIDKHFPKQKANRNKSFVRGSSLVFFFYYSTVGRLTFDEPPALFSPPHPSHLIYNMHFFVSRFSIPIGSERARGALYM